MALNENRRPPFTTLAVRFTLITRSVNSERPADSVCLVPRSRRSPVAMLEAQSPFPRSVRERLDAPVVEIAGAVEGDAGDPRRLGPLGQLPAHRLAPVGLALGAGERGPGVLAHRGSRDQRAPRGVVHDLGVDLVQAPPNGETRALRGAGDLLSDPVVAPAPAIFRLRPTSHDRLPRLGARRLAG